MNKNEALRLVIDSLVNHCVKVIDSTVPLIDNDIDFFNTKMWVMENLINSLHNYKNNNYGKTTTQKTNNQTQSNQADNN